MKSDKIIVEEKGDVARLTLNRPEKGNAVDGEMMAALTEALAGLNAAGRVRLLVLSGKGEHFCSGREPGSAPPQGVRGWAEVLGRITRVNEELKKFSGVTIALVQGRAHGFGCGLAVQSDVTLAAEDSRFAFPEIKAGFPPTIVMSYLSRWMSRKRAFELVATGEEIDAREAERLGLVNRVVPRERLAAEGERWIETLLKQNADALRACKAFFHDTAHWEIEDAARYGVTFLANFMADARRR